MCPAQGLEGWINREVLQKAQWGSNCQGRCCRCCCLRLGHSPGQSLHGPRRALELLWTSRLNTEMSIRTLDLPPAVPCLCCLCSHFWIYAMAGGQRQPSGEWSSRRCRQPAFPWGSLECPKLENWPPSCSCLPQHNYSDMTNMTN